MRILLRKIVSRIAGKRLRSKLKHMEYKLRKGIIKKTPKLSAEEIRKILVEDLGLTRGDNIFVHGSTDMIHTDLTPREIVTILLDIVGEEGSLSVPTFIRYSSKDWMERDEKFHYRKTVSGMGMISEVVRKNKESLRSLHPTKSVATIGRIAGDVLGEHHLSEFPFGDKSPFYKLLKYNVKIVGVGVPMSYLSMVHTVEDCNPERFPVKVNEDIVYSKTCIDQHGNEIPVQTYVHNLAVVAKADPEKFVTKYVDKTRFKLKNHYLTPFFVIDGNVLYAELVRQMERGHTIYD